MHLQKQKSKSPIKILFEEFSDVDSVLTKYKSGLIASSDSELIDHSQIRVFDLARFVLQTRYSPDFFDLTYINL